MKRLLMKWICPFKFAVVGIVNTVSSLFLYYLLLFQHANYLFSTVLAYIGSSILGYFLNKTFVFQAKGMKISDSLLRYYIVYGTSLCLNLGCMYLWVQILSMNEIIAPLLTMCITIPYNYLFSKFWVFKESPKKEEQ